MSNETLEWVVEKITVLFVLVCCTLLFRAMRKRKNADNQMVSLPRGLSKSPWLAPVNLLIILLSSLFIPWPRKDVTVNRLQNPKGHRFSRFAMTYLQIGVATVWIMFAFYLVNGLPD